MIADFFSRHPNGQFESTDHDYLSIDVLETEIGNDERHVYSVVEVSENLKKSLKNLSILQRQDEFFILKEDILFLFIFFVTSNNEPSVI